MAMSDENKASRSEHMKAVHAKRREAKEAQKNEVAGLVDQGLGMTQEAGSTSGAVRTEGQRNKRPRRNMFNGTQQRLAVYGSIPGYHLHIFNDEAGRIEQALATGYEFVEPHEVDLETSRRVTETNGAVDNKIRHVVGKTEGNNAQYAYLMKIKQEYFDEDQKAAQDEISAKENYMLRNGGSNADSIQNTYIPNGRKSALEISRK